MEGAEVVVGRLMVIMPPGHDDWAYGVWGMAQSERGRMKRIPQWDLGHQYRHTEPEKFMP